MQRSSTSIPSSSLSLPPFLHPLFSTLRPPSSVLHDPCRYIRSPKVARSPIYENSKLFVEFRNQDELSICVIHGYFAQRAMSHVTRHKPYPLHWYGTFFPLMAQVSQGPRPASRRDPGTNTIHSPRTILCANRTEITCQITIIGLWISKRNLI